MMSAVSTAAKIAVLPRILSPPSRLPLPAWCTHNTCALVSRASTRSDSSACVTEVFSTKPLCGREVLQDDLKPGGRVQAVPHLPSTQPCANLTQPCGVFTGWGCLTGHMRGPPG